MSPKKISMQVLDAWVAELVAQTKVLGVQAKDDHFQWAELSKASDLRLDYDVSLTRAKRVFSRRGTCS